MLCYVMLNQNPLEKNAFGCTYFGLQEEFVQYFFYCHWLFNLPCDVFKTVNGSLFTNSFNLSQLPPRRISLLLKPPDVTNWPFTFSPKQVSTKARRCCVKLLAHCKILETHWLLGVFLMTCNLYIRSLRIQTTGNTQVSTLVTYSPSAINL